MHSILPATYSHCHLYFHDGGLVVVILSEAFFAESKDLGEPRESPALFAGE
jgi:hypothetical protein